jgi:hypothetical protein
MPWSVLEEYEDHGLYFTPANNEILGSINRVKEFLKIKKGRVNPRTGTRPSPQLFVFSRCVNLIQEMKRYQWSQVRNLALKNPIERPQKYMDHAVDALRYMVMSRFPGPVKNPSNLLLVKDSYKGAKNLIAEELPKGYEGDPLLGKYYGSEVSTPLSIDNYE